MPTPGGLNPSKWNMNYFNIYNKILLQWKTLS